MSRADKFFQMCTTLPFEESKDTRDEHAVPEIVQIARLRDSGNMQEAIDYGKSLSKMYPDLDLIPFMISYIYYQKDFPQEAFDLAVAAIPRCPRKYRLYAVAGLAEFKRDHLPEAVVWWSRSVVAQCSVTDFQESEAFLHLAHSAEIVGAKREAEMLFTMADAIDQGAERLGPEVTNKLAELKNTWAHEALQRVLKHIDKNYLHTA